MGSEMCIRDRSKVHENHHPRMSSVQQNNRKVQFINDQGLNSIYHSIAVQHSYILEEKKLGLKAHKLLLLVI